MLPMIPLARCDSQGRVVMLFFPFWRFDAKGGEGVLLGISDGICMGKHKCICVYHFIGTCAHLSFALLN